MKFTLYTSHILEKRHKGEHSYTLETDNLNSNTVDKSGYIKSKHIGIFITKMN